MPGGIPDIRTQSGAQDGGSLLRSPVLRSGNSCRHPAIGRNEHGLGENPNAKRRGGRIAPVRTTGLALLTVRFNQ